MDISTDAGKIAVVTKKLREAVERLDIRDLPSASGATFSFARRLGQAHDHLRQIAERLGAAVEADAGKLTAVHAAVIGEDERIAGTFQIGEL
jgi:hypothetical protein